MNLKIQFQRYCHFSDAQNNQIIQRELNTIISYIYLKINNSEFTIK